MIPKGTQLRAQLGSLLLDPYENSRRRELYAVRFHPTVRQYMKNTKLVPYREHLDWTRKHLLDTSGTHLWLIKTGNDSHAVGLTQLKFGADRNVAEIGVMFRDPEKHRLACATSSAITLHLAFVEFACTCVYSYVVSTAHHAVAFNVGGGFSITSTDREGMVCLRMDRDTYLSNEINRRVMSRIANRLKISAITREA